MKTIAILGLGNRGGVYAKNLAKNERAKIVSVCDVKRESLQSAKEVYGVKEENLFTDENIFFEKKRADILIIATMDELHYRQVIKALSLGYDVLLEKPVSPVYDECKKIAEYAKETGRKVVVCHNLRYTPFYQRLKRIVVDGEIGDVVSMEQSENVAFSHYMCSFVRGKWHRKEDTSPIILQKCCHDLDIIYWIIGKKCEKLSSFGSLSFYNKAHKPKDGAMNCIDCKKKDCVYDSRTLYVKFPSALDVPYGFEKTEENILRYLSDKDNDYGKCVYEMDNDVCDRQTVNMQFEGGVTASLFMHGFAASGTHRITTVYGTKGKVSGRLEKGIWEVELYNGEKKTYDVKAEIKDGASHSGGDSKLIEDVVEYFENGTQVLGLSLVEDSMYSHKLAFTAEESRESGDWVSPGREL